MHRLVSFLLSAIGLGLLLGGTAAAQDAGTTPLPQTDSNAMAPAAASPLGALPLELQPADLAPLPSPAGDLQTPVAAPAWTWQRQTQNPQGSVTNLHERVENQDGGSFRYQHAVSRPNGSHTQLREYQRTEDGYSLLQQQSFYRPDGTLLREHAMSVTGTDPYNYQRQMTHTFRDGRTMEKTFTRSYDGEAGTIAQTFVGPNGQVRHLERPWAPDDPATAGQGLLAPDPLPTPERAGLPTREQLATSPAARADEGGFWSRLNPFKKRHAKQTANSPAPKRSGFTVGSFGRSQDSTIPPGLARKTAGESPTHVRRSAAKTRQTGPPAHALGAARGSAGKNR